MRRKTLFPPTLVALILTALLAVPFVSADAPPGPFFQGFETDNVGWELSSPAGPPAARVASGTNGIPSKTGAFHAEVKNNFTRWGGYSSTFPPGGYVTSAAIYLDPNGGFANDTRFDYSSAINNTSAPTTAHRRDFVFNAGYYNDATAPGSGPRFVVSASNGAGRSAAFPKNPGRQPIAITAPGWYTFRHSFHNIGGKLSVDLSIIDSSNNVVKTWTLSDPSDLIGTTVGGNRYGWFASNEFPFLAIDDTSRLSYPFDNVLVVSPANQQGWVIQTSGTSTATFVNGPGTPPLGTGSGELSVGSNGGGAAQFRHGGYAGTLLSDLTELSYSAYTSNDVTPAPVGDQTVYIMLNVDLDGNGSTDTILFFEPEYQHGYTTAVPDQGDNVLNTWQMWDALHGGWWSSTNVAGASPGTNVKPLSAIIAAFPNARLATGTSVRIVAGFGIGAWDNFVGNVDAFTIGVGANVTTYDFEADRDGDGSLDVDDCNDDDPDIYPGAPEVCDGIDNDCDGVADDGVTPTFYRDADNDGFGDPNDSTQSCSAPPGYVSNNTDNCPTTSNPTQFDQDNDGVGDACDGDIDGDGVPNGPDNCDFVPNTGQQDFDGNGIGDACETDVPVRPTSKDQCKNGSWMMWTPRFKNQGDCVSYTSNGGK